MKKTFIAITILCGLILVSVVAIGIICIEHPITGKWLSGDARIIGKPINALVYTDGHINNNISVFRNNGTNAGQTLNDYVLSLKQCDKYGMLKYINIDLVGKLVGRPVGISIDCYDMINGYLFQDEVGAHFIDFKDNMKGFDFDPKLVFNNKQIEFKTPPGMLNFNTIRIVLAQ